MATVIRIEPESLEQHKNRLEGYIAEYISIYNQLYNEVDAMRQSWTSVTNQKFAAQIEESKTDFIALSELLKRYAEFIQLTTKMYRTTEQDIASAAGKLSSGRH